jgi:hypothetical protein
VMTMTMTIVVAHCRLLVSVVVDGAAFDFDFDFPDFPYFPEHVVVRIRRRLDCPQERPIMRAVIGNWNERRLWSNCNL